MRFLFVHQNMPGQYRELLSWLSATKAHEIVFLTQRQDRLVFKGVKQVVYTAHHRPAARAFGLSKVWEEAAGVGYGAAQAAKTLRDEGFTPDIVLGHTGWGELLFLKQIWPDVPILGLFEYYYQSQIAFGQSDAEDMASDATPFLLQARNTTPQSSLFTVDRGVVPTRWQRDCFPQIFHNHIDVCHDGIRTDRLQPDPHVWIDIARAGRLTVGDEILTYAARNMEPMRGFRAFMRALPKIQAARPNARALIVGGSDVSYGRSSTSEGGFRSEMEAEVGHLVDWTRVHFLGRIPYDNFCKVLQLSRCHLYLTKPFVLSWSLLEAMSMETTIIASDVEPVREAVTNGETGLLVDPTDADLLAERVCDVLADPQAHAHLGQAARVHVIRNYDFLNVCLPRYLSLMNSLLPKSLHLSSS